MIFIVNKCIPKEAVSNLQKYGHCFSFLSENITNQYIAGHPDVFCCSVGDVLVASEPLFSQLKNNSEILSCKTSIIIGNSKVGYDVDATHYNAVVTDRYVIHNQRYIDDIIVKYSFDRIFINVKQGFTRCSLLPLPNNMFLTSDNGIAKQLKNNNIECLCVTQESIVLPGCKFGCIGGCFGVSGTTVFCIGDLLCHPDGEAIREFIALSGCQLVALYDGPLFDGGSIIVVE